MSELLALAFLGIGLLIAAFPVAVLVLVVVTIGLHRRVRALQARVEVLERAAADRHLGPIPPVTRPAQPAPASPPPGPEAVAVAPPATAVGSGEPGGPEPVAATSASAAPSPPSAPAASPGTGWSQLEGRLGGTWLNRVGALVLVLGIGFFLKYAFDNDWIGPAGRVSIGLLTGIVLLVVGERLQRAAYRIPAQGLTAAGVATLYLAGYAAHELYRLVTSSAGFAFMTLVTATGMAIAIRHDARAVALFAGLGGYLAPVLLNTGADAATSLFTYLTILDAGILLAASWRGWTSLFALAFVGTQLLYWGWLDRWYGPGHLAVTLIGGTAFFALFALAGLVGMARRGSGGDRGFGGRLTGPVILAVPTLYFLASRRILAGQEGPWLALLCLALAAGYLVAGLWALSVARDRPIVALLHLTLALAFLTLTFAVQFSEHALAIAWSVEGLLLLWGGFRLGAPKLRLGALVVLVLAWGRWLDLVLGNPGGPGPFLLAHPALPATVVVALTAGLAGALYRTAAPGRRWEAAARPLLILVSLGSLALLVTVEFHQGRASRIPPPYVNVAATVVWVVTAMPVLALARGDRTRILLGAATTILVVAAAATVSEAPGWERIDPRLRPLVLNPRFFAGLLLVVVGWLYARVVPEFPHVSEGARRRLGAVAGGVSALLLLWNLSTEVLLMPLAGVPVGEAAKLRSAALSILWALCAFVAMGLGMWRRRPALRAGAIGLFGLTVAKVFLADLAGLDAAYRILSFVVLGGLLLLASFLYARYRRRSAGEAP